MKVINKDRSTERQNVSFHRFSNFDFTIITAARRHNKQPNLGIDKIIICQFSYTL